MWNENIKNEIRYQHLYNYLEKYSNKTIEIKEYAANQDVLVNKTIWLFWMQGIENAPAIVKKCVSSVLKNKPSDFEAVILTEVNLSDYIQLPDFIWEKYRLGYITKTHLSDIIRAELLYMYGGAWIDATVFCSDSIPSYMLDGEFFMFKTTKLSASVIKGSSWWIYAKKGERIIAETRMLLYKYWSKERKIRNYFLFHIALARVIDNSSYNRATYRDMPSKCNSDPHNLWAVLATEYREDMWNIIKSNSTIHKLSYKRKFIQGDIYSFYMALMEGQLDSVTKW